VLFKRKGTLKTEYDKKLLSQLEQFKRNWNDEKSIYEKCLETNEDLDFQMKLAEIKYFYLFKEAKARNIRVGMNK